MQSPNTRYGPQPAALKWAIGIGAAVLIIVALVLSAGPAFDARAVAQPTPCPDSIACHALKRMPQQNALATAVP